MGCSPEAGAACPDCLERRILSDLAGSGLSFVHGLSDSPLPFASSAVVQIASDGAEEQCWEKWWKGELSNYEYLLVLNKLAGRRWGDPAFHTVMPWVIDFTVIPDESSDNGWRDLTKSKWRLAKGDEQLDFTYSSSEVPHHVSDECLSELAVCSYKARRLPKTILRSAVRSVYEPNEYPSTMQRLYQWTPDECIPEFYIDPRIFMSLHSEMSNLALPSWATSTEDFISLHRDALESDRVSQQLHHWIDITFGYKLAGEASVEAKKYILLENGSLEDFEQSTLFTELENHLNPIYDYSDTSTCWSSDKYPSGQIADQILQPENVLPVAPDFDFGSFLECFEPDDGSPVGYQELLLWNQRSYTDNEDHANDVFSVGCMLAEIYLHRPLFDTTMLAAYKETGILPGTLQELPSHVALLVESCIQREWKRRPSAKHLLQSSYFPPSVQSAYMFLAPLQVLCTSRERIKYVAKLASGLLGESFTVKQILPLLRNVIFSCIDSSKMSKPEPQNSWNSHALIDSLSALEGLVSVLPVKAVLKELLQVYSVSFLGVACGDRKASGMLFNMVSIGASSSKIVQLEGWSIPQSGINKNSRNAAAAKLGFKHDETSGDNTPSSGNQPWFWFPSPHSSRDAPDFLGRGGGVRDELPWKIKASVLYSARAHPGALRSLAVHDDECTVFTGGVGPGFKGSIQRWELPNMNCTSGYYGHEEVT
ncbi:hypothetical protein PR202_ga29892 [Eleusine coracana subsp. coracana]|uniref:BEACH domain-containing protein n=1 Tax=Eleusine coracana subsp. coracana TaxID=191504 RepID=A0AAV5DL50_ELECO|nr:hypothetical protein PR202_ga29892 [Eleusine coracana subsp. coracana]